MQCCRGCSTQPRFAMRPPGLTDMVIAATARESYQRAGWARHWLEQATNAVDPVDFWRFGTLASGVVDLHFMALWRRLPNTEMVYRFGSDLHARLKKAAIERLQ